MVIKDVFDSLISAGEDVEALRYFAKEYYESGRMGYTRKSLIDRCADKLEQKQNMCWCKDCKWYCKEHCVNHVSDWCTEPVDEYSSCKHCARKEDVKTEEYEKGFRDGYREGVDDGLAMQG